MAVLPSEPPPLSVPMMGRLNPADAAIWETFVVPRYLSLFGELALEAVVEIEQAQVVHIGCRTGYPDRGLAMKLPDATIVGTDPSPHALALARAKAVTMSAMVADYREAVDFPLPLPDAAFSHALALHPFVGRVQPAPPDSPKPGELVIPEENARTRLFAEMKRLLAPRGQLLVALPLQGSFIEIADLLREFALKFEDSSLSLAIDRALALRPTVEMISAELEEEGFEYIDVSLRPATLAFHSGRDLLEDPVTRLCLLPEFRSNLGVEELDRPMSYVREALDKYWSDGTFELTVNVGCASARRAG